MDYYYTDASNQTRGPVSLAELQALAASGQVTPATMVAAVGSQQWVSVTTVLQTFGGAPVSQVPGTAPAAGFPPGTMPASAPTEPLSVWSLVTSLVGLFCGCVFIGSLTGIITGHMALSAIKKKPGFGGRGMAIAGLIIGYLGLAWWLVYFLFIGGMAIMEGLNQH